jgi:hypothetical protein
MAASTAAPWSGGRTIVICSSAARSTSRVIARTLEQVTWARANAPPPPDVAVKINNGHDHPPRTSLSMKEILEIATDNPRDSAHEGDMINADAYSTF